MGFDYDSAFARNLGWVTREEQGRLRGKRVAIAGLGGVGGVHLLTLARLGIGSFSIADFDVFDWANFNRQVGATVDTVGRPKVEVLAEMARAINPQAELRLFPQGVRPDNVDDFLAGADAYVDGLDFFAFAARELTFARCHALGVPAITVAPLGMGAALLNFLPGRMSFEDYFGVAGRSDDEKRVRFLVGLSPALLQRRYLVDPTYVDFDRQAGPSTPMSVQLCAGIAATEALKLLLGRGEVLAAPWGIHYDAYRNTSRRTWRPGGWRNPVQRLTAAIARRQLARGRPAGAAAR